MAGESPVCLICGEDLTYSPEAQKYICAVCGREETGNTTCTNGHYVCNTCHRKGGVELAHAVCLETKSRNPIDILQTIMNDKSVYPNGPEHHTAVGMALLAAYANSGGELDLGAALDELEKRSMLVPGGTCGFWGCCGAAVSAGQYWSVITGGDPLNEGPWEQCQRLTSRTLDHIASIGGVRCCKRVGFIAVQEAATYTQELKGVKMEMPESIVCTHFRRNKQCLQDKCPFFPKNKEELDAQMRAEGGL